MAFLGEPSSVHMQFSALPDQLLSNMGNDRYYTLAEGSSLFNLSLCLRLTRAGCPFANNKTAVLMRGRQGGSLGLLQDTQLIETLAHFSRERIPERLVMASLIIYSILTNIQCRPRQSCRVSPEAISRTIILTI